MKTNVQFVLDRSSATDAAAVAIVADWEWAEESNVQMSAETKALAAQASLSDTADTALTDAISQKNTALAGYHHTTVVLLGMTKTHYRNQPAALATLKNLQALGKSDQDIVDEGAALATIWMQLDPTYVPDKLWPLAAYQATGTDCANKILAVTTADVAWSQSSAQTDAMAAAKEDKNCAWYADATKTQHGVMIRQTVPTTSRTVQPPGAPVVDEAQAMGGGKVHIDFEKPASGYIQILH